MRAIHVVVVVLVSAIVLAATGLAMAAQAKGNGKGAQPPPAAVGKRIQEVDLKRLEIQGKLDTPSSLFILDSGQRGIAQVWAVDALLGGGWIGVIDKEDLDRVVMTPIAE